MITLYHRAEDPLDAIHLSAGRIGGAIRTPNRHAQARRRQWRHRPRQSPSAWQKCLPFPTTGVVVFESPAIALYLTDRFPQNGIGPVVSDRKRGTYLSWLAYYGDVLEPAFISEFMKMEVPRGAAGWVPVKEVMEFVIKTLFRPRLYSGRQISQPPTCSMALRSRCSAPAR